MKTVPHVVEDKYLRLFHGESIQKPARKKRVVKRIVKKKRTVQKKKKIVRKKPIKGGVKRKISQSVSRRRRGNIKDILS